MDHNTPMRYHRQSWMRKTVLCALHYALCSEYRLPFVLDNTHHFLRCPRSHDGSLLANIRNAPAIFIFTLNKRVCFVFDFQYCRPPAVCICVSSPKSTSPARVFASSKMDSVVVLYMHPGQGDVDRSGGVSVRGFLRSAGELIATFITSMLPSSPFFPREWTSSSSLNFGRDLSMNCAACEASIPEFGSCPETEMRSFLLGTTTFAGVLNLAQSYSSCRPSWKPTSWSQPSTCLPDIGGGHPETRSRMGRVNVCGAQLD
ncbi:uncharacterized protein M421DRAFT_409116, partial [Didymella exigua CBS 183.55]